MNYKLGTTNEQLPVIQEQACGSCTLCCNVFTITELNKPANEWCPECAVGVNCKIYDTRPKSCRDFICMWALHSCLPEQLRPDKVHACMWSPIGMDNTVVVNVDPAFPKAFEEGLLGDLLRQMVTELHRVVIIVIGEKRKQLVLEADYQIFLTNKGDSK